jgi:molecular chaperone GrpE (heat shock protein)
MNERRLPSMTKWPYYVADVVLAVLAIWIVKHYPHPLPFWPATLMVGCVVVAAALGIWPHRMEYQTAVQFAEADGLADAIKEVRNVQAVAEQIRLATGQWQGVQEHSAKTVAAAKEVSERITAEAQAFAEFMQKANDSEKASLRLEVEKLRRSESQWLQVLVLLLDHVFALHQAGSRSGQPNLEAQLGRFQEACRDVVRRVGLSPFEAGSDEPFDTGKHQVPEGQPQPEPGARIAQTLAAGYTFQGQLIRRSLVALRQPYAEESVPLQDSLSAAAGSGSEDEFSATPEEDTARHETLTAGPRDANGELTAEQGFRLESESPASSTDELRQA